MGKQRAWIEEHTLYVVVILLLIWMMAVRLPLDSDMWWHLQAGEQTLRQGEVYRIDSFSFTRTGAEWINHSWLSQVLMALILRIAGFPGLSIWVAICAVLSMGLVYLQMEGHPLLRGGVVLLAGTVSSVVWSPRPQVMSLVLLAFVSWLIYQYRSSGQNRLLLLLPPVFTLWGNLHGGYVLGLLYLGAVIAGIFFDQFFNVEGEDAISGEELGWLAAATVLSGIAVLINPFGFEMWKIPFNTVGVETLQNLITEWASPDFHQPFQQPFLVLLLALLAVFALSKNKVSAATFFPVLLFTWAALTARRNFGPFALIAAPPLARYSAVVFDGWKERSRAKWPKFDQFFNKVKSSNRDFNPVFRNLINLSIVILLVFTGIVKTVAVNQADLFSIQESEIYPADAANWLVENSESVRMFNEYNWGGYLIYRLPGIPVFVDGRTDLFGDEILSDYVQVMELGTNWDNILENYHINTLVLQADSALTEVAQYEDWEIIFQDQVTAILRIRE